MEKQPLNMSNLSDNPDSPSLWRLINLAAPAITGRKCIVKRQDPTGNASGETSVNLGGIPVVTIAKDQVGAEFMATLLHELAHVKYHAKFMAKTDIENEPPNSRPYHKNNPEWETQADAQALEWAKYGNAKRDHNLPKDVGILLALVEQNTN